MQMLVIDAPSPVHLAGHRIVVLGPLQRLDDSRRRAFWDAVRGGHDQAPEPPPAARGRIVASLLSLAAGRADVVVATDLGAPGLLAGLYRSVFRGASFYVLLTEPPARLRRLGRIVLRLADAVLVDGDATARVVSQPWFPARSVRRITPRYPVGAAGAARHRPTPPAGTRRIAVAGPLSPQSGTPDVLASAAAWAEAHPHCTVELAWTGEGDLAGVLAAQPLPPNMTQSFPGAAGAEAAVAQAEFLIVPGLADDGQLQVAASFAAGLPVLGSKRRWDVRLLVTEAVNGWLFDPARPGDLHLAFGRALDVPPDALQTMGARAQAALKGSAPLPMPAGGRRAAATPTAPALQPQGASMAQHVP